MRYTSFCCSLVISRAHKTLCIRSTFCYMLAIWTEKGLVALYDSWNVVFVWSNPIRAYMPTLDHLVPCIVLADSTSTPLPPWFDILLQIDPSSKCTIISFRLDFRLSTTGNGIPLIMTNSLEISDIPQIQLKIILTVGCCKRLAWWICHPYAQKCVE